MLFVPQVLCVSLPITVCPIWSLIFWNDWK